jgi:very-short-patch-repair endonuclease
MGTPGDTPPARADVCHVENVIAGIARRKKGLVTEDELRSAGLGPKGIRSRVERGALHRLFPRVYLVGHAVAPPWAMELGAVLACAPDSFLSHFSAARLYALLKMSVPHVDVTVVGRNQRKYAGISVHRVRTIDPRDITKHAGIPTTTPARILLDLAEVAQPRQLEIAWDDAHARKLVTPARVNALMERSPGRHGLKRLAALIARDSGHTLSRSDAEELLLELIRRSQLASPEMNVLLGRYRVDFLWREQRLILELDGGHHLRPRQRDSDNRRDSDLANAGWRVERVSFWELENFPEAVIARLARALG